jgi:F-type H+-transporting ATPase subunit delta
MRSQETARRYAEALYTLAVEENCVETIDNDYRRVVEEIKDVPDFLRFLTHPLVSHDDKRALLSEAFPDITEYLHNLFSLLVRNGREGYIDMIYDEFERQRGSEEGIVQAQVITAQELTPEDRKRLSDHLAKKLGRQVRLDEQVDKNLIGGLRIEVDGKVIDGSLRARLDELKTVLAG